MKPLNQLLVSLLANFAFIIFNPISAAGLSKHVRMAIISYSAEGATFVDREKYPYFYRTIGENRQ